MSEDSAGEDSAGVETVGWRSFGRDQVTLGSSLLGQALCMRVPEAHPALTSQAVQQQVVGAVDDCDTRLRQLLRLAGSDSPDPPRWCEDRLYRDCGFDTLAAMVRGSLSVSTPTLEHRRR